MDAPVENYETLTDGINDAAIASRTKTALTGDRNTSGATDASYVETNGGVVMLAGDVASQATAEHAQLWWRSCQVCATL
jgi:osmotically-inducible protein OsmY